MTTEDPLQTFMKFHIPCAVGAFHFVVGDHILTLCDRYISPVLKVYWGLLFVFFMDSNENEGSNITRKCKIVITEDMFSFKDKCVIP
jgi:hypothetical protein